MYSQMLGPVCSEMTLVMYLPLLFGKHLFSSIRCFKFSYNNCFPLLGTPVVYISRAERSPSESFCSLASVKRQLCSKLGGEVNALLNQNLFAPGRNWQFETVRSHLVPLNISEGCWYDWLLNKWTCKTPSLKFWRIILNIMRQMLKIKVFLKVNLKGLWRRES